MTLPHLPLPLPGPWEAASCFTQRSIRAVPPPAAACADLLSPLAPHTLPSLPFCSLLPSHSLNIHLSLSGTYCCSLASHRCPIRSSCSPLFYYTQICSLLFLKPLSCRAVYCPHKHDHNWCRTAWNILHTQPLQNVLIVTSIEETWLTIDFKRKVLACC